MEHNKTTVLNDGFAGEVVLEETADGQRFVRKTYAAHSTFDIHEEWDALVFLYHNGYSVPQPIRRGHDSITMQYIENGDLWGVYNPSDESKKDRIIEAFTRLLYDLHALDASDTAKPNKPSFIRNEFSEMHSIITQFQLDDYRSAFDTLKALSGAVQEYPPCLIHRDYHPWNVLSDQDGKLYAIDLVLRQGDFRFDVAWTFMLMTRSGYGDFAERFFSEYSKLNPQVNFNFEFFKKLANLRWLLNVKSAMLLDQEKNREPGEKDEFMRRWIENAELLL